MLAILQIVCQKIDIMTTKKPTTPAAATGGAASEKKVRKPAAKRSNTRKKTTPKATGETDAPDDAAMQKQDAAVQQDAIVAQEAVGQQTQDVAEQPSVASQNPNSEKNTLADRKSNKRSGGRKQRTAKPQAEQVETKQELQVQTESALLDAEPVVTQAEPDVEPLHVQQVEQPVGTPVEAETVKQEVVKPEPAKPESVKQELAQPELIKSESVKPEPVKPESVKPIPQPVVVPDLPQFEIDSIVDLAQAPQRSIVLTDQQIQQLTLEELSERHAYLQNLLASVLDYDVVISDTNIWLELFLPGGHGDQRNNVRLQFERQMEFISKLVKHRGCRFMMMGETYEEIDRFATMQDPTNHKEADFSDNVVCLNTAARLAKRLILSQQRENRLRIEGLGAESHHASFADPAIIRKVVELFSEGKKVLLITNDASVAIRSIGLCDDLQRVNGVADEVWDSVYAPLRPMVFTFDDLKLLDNYTRQYHYIQMASGEPWMCRVGKREKAGNVPLLDLWLEAFRPGDKHRGDNLFTDQEMQLLQKKEQQKQSLNQQKQASGQQKQMANQQKQASNQQKQTSNQQKQAASQPKKELPEVNSEAPVVAEEVKTGSRSRRKPSGRGKKQTGAKAEKTMENAQEN